MTTWRDSSAAEFAIGGWSLERMAARAGKTPFFVYDRSALGAHVERVRKALPDGTKLWYSPKANPHAAMVQYLAGLVDGLDVASHKELAVALDGGVGPERCLFTGPGKTRDEIRAAVACGAIVNLESALQARHCAEAGTSFGVRPAVSLRLNCSFAPKRAGMKEVELNQFGVDPDEAPALLAEIGAMDLDFRGFHAFWGSQFFDPQLIAEGQRKAYALAASLIDAAPRVPSFINVGSGIAARFFADEKYIDLGAVSAAIRDWVDVAAVAKQPWDLVFEMGRYLVAECGHYVARVLERKIIRGETFLVVDGGINHFLLGAGAFAQNVRRDVVARVGNKFSQPETETVTIVGPLCTIMDRFATEILLPKAEPGDFIVLANAGAYGASFSPANFLSHPPAAEILV
jgi:diaminopimelate decarboxylase